MQEPITYTTTDGQIHTLYPMGQGNAELADSEALPYVKPVQGSNEQKDAEETWKNLARVGLGWNAGSFTY